MGQAECVLVTGLYTDGMMFGISTQFWGGMLRAPIARMLLLSAALHLAFVVLFQAGHSSGGKRVVLINARLLDLPAQTTPVSAEALVPIEKLDIETPSQLLTALSPSTAPPIASQPPPINSPEPQAAPALPEPTPTSAEPPAASTSAGSELVTDEAERLESQASVLPTLDLGIDTNWYLARQVDVQPKPIDRVEPKYPPEAKQQNLGGTLKLMLKIDDLGRVQSVEVVEAIPPDLFDQSALEAFSKARFRPAMKDGRPVRFQAYIRVDFKLKD